MCGGRRCRVMIGACAASLLVLLQARFSQQPALPLELRAHDLFEIVVARGPVQDLPHALGLCDQRWRVAGAPWFFDRPDRPSADPVDHRNNLADAVAVTI